jgi:hypothetical protein
MPTRADEGADGEIPQTSRNNVVEFDGPEDHGFKG